MNERVIAFLGLAVFVTFFTIPIWRQTPGVRIAPPNLKLPAGEKECVAPKAFMRTSHMELLTDWRDDAVRDGQREFIAVNGKHYDKSLTRTCLGQCHGNHTEFCDRCHSYNGVRTDSCWACHNEPHLAVRSTS